MAATNFNWTDVSRTGYEALSQGNYDQAEKLFRTAIDQGGFHSEDLRLAYSFLVLGRCLSQKGDWTGAEPMYKRAGEIYEKVYGQNHEDVAFSFVGQARCRMQCAQYDSAMKLYKKALAIYEQIRGDEHEDIATSLDGIGQCYMSCREYEQAIPIYERVSQMFCTLRGPFDEGLGNAFFSLGRCYDELNNDKKAAPYFRRALEVYEQLAEPDKEQIANCSYNLARCYQGLREFLKAEPLYRGALKVFQTTPGLERSAAYCCFALSTCFMVSGDYRAEEYLKKALAAYEKVFGTTHYQTACVLEAYARYLTTTCRASEAKHLEDRAKQIREKMR